MIQDTVVEALREESGGDPAAYGIRGTVIVRWRKRHQNFSGTIQWLRGSAMGLTKSSTGAGAIKEMFQVK